MSKIPGLKIKNLYNSTSLLGGPHRVAVLSVFLDEDGFCCISATSEPHKSWFTPESVQLFRDMMWYQKMRPGSVVKADLTKIRALIGQLRPLLERVHAGHTLEYRDAVIFGRLTSDAEAASLQIWRLINAADWARDCCDRRRYLASMDAPQSQEILFPPTPRGKLYATRKLT